MANPKEALGISLQSFREKAVKVVKRSLPEILTMVGGVTAIASLAPYIIEAKTIQHELNRRIPLMTGTQLQGLQPDLDDFHGQVDRAVGDGQVVIDIRTLADAERIKYIQNLLDIQKEHQKQRVELDKELHEKNDSTKLLYPFGGGIILSFVGLFSQMRRDRRRSSNIPAEQVISPT